MKAIYCVVGSDIAVTETTIQALKRAAHDLIIGNPEVVLVWQSNFIGGMAIYMSTDEAEARRFIVPTEEA